MHGNPSVRFCAPLLVALATIVSWAGSGFAAPVLSEFVIEPDDFADHQVLNHVSPHVTLSTGAFDDNRPTFDVVAFIDEDDTSTGSKVFAHGGGIPFWNDGRTFRMDFHSLVTSVSIDYIASGFFDNLYTGRLEAYSPSGTLLDSYTTAPLAEGRFETMTVSAPAIAYALAYPPDDPFGDLDHLRFTVPEPSALAFLGVAALLLASRTGRRR